MVIKGKRKELIEDIIYLCAYNRYNPDDPNDWIHRKVAELIREYNEV